MHDTSVSFWSMEVYEILNRLIPVQILDYFTFKNPFVV